VAWGVSGVRVWCALLKPSSSLPQKYAGAMQIEVTPVVEKPLCGYSLAECVEEAVVAGKVVEDDRAAKNYLLLNSLQNSIRWREVVRVNEGKHNWLTLQYGHRLDNVSRNNFNVAVVKYLAEQALI
jgi:hypothetical protein